MTKRNITEKETRVDDDPIAEIRRIREAHAKKFDYDAATILDDLADKQKKADRRVVSFPSKRAVKDTGS